MHHGSTMVDFKDRLKAALEHAGLTPVQLASRLGVTRQAIENAVKGRSESLSAENCAKAGRVLGVDLYWLATGDGEMVNKDQDAVEVWPFPVVDRSRYERLDAKGRGYVQATVVEIIEELEAKQAASLGKAGATNRQTLGPVKTGQAV